MILYDLNPFNLILDVVNRIYPALDAKISFVPEEEFELLMKRWGATDKEVKQSCGVTMFDDEGKTPIICINASIPCYASIEIIAHEVAHVAVGVKAGHGKKWKAEFNKIFTEYSAAHDKIQELL